MVARIETRRKEGDWTFECNVMPGSSRGISAPLMDGGEEVIAVMCDEEDRTTTVTWLKEGDFEIRGDDRVDFFKEPDVTLRLGDPHFVVSILSQLNSDMVEVRVSHQAKF